MNLRTLARQYGVALRAMVVFTVVLGIAYTALVTGVGRLVDPAAASGSVVTVDTSAGSRVVGSALIGQSFADEKGKALPEWFQSRPSAAGATDDNPGGYDAGASSGSNLGPSNPDLVTSVRERRAAIAKADGVPVSSVPADAVTASGSGLDPDISPEYAAIQVRRVAAARGLSVATVRALVAAHTDGRQLGFMGEPRVNVLELNLALASR